MEMWSLGVSGPCEMYMLCWCVRKLVSIMSGHLILRHVNRVDFHSDAILNRPCNTFREGGDMLLPVLINKYFCLPFGDNDADIQIDNLPGLMSGIPIFSRRQESPVYRDGLDNIGVADMAMKPLVFAVGAL